MVRSVSTSRTPKFAWNRLVGPPISIIRELAVVRSVTWNELSLSTKNRSVLLGTPAPDQTDCRKVDGLVIPPVVGFFTVMVPTPKLLTFRARAGFDNAVE